MLQIPGRSIDDQRETRWGRTQRLEAMKSIKHIEPRFKFRSTRSIELIVYLNSRLLIAARLAIFREKQDES